MSKSHQKDALLAQRYGQDHVPENVIFNPQIEGLLCHRSVRHFSDRALPVGWLETMVAAAQSASTSSNLQQWSLVAVTDPQVKAQVQQLCAGEAGSYNAYIGSAPAVLLWVADMSRNHEITVADGLEPQVYDYLDAFLMASVDAALAAQNASVAAEAIGLGVVYIGASRNKAKELAELLNLPQYSYVVCGLLVGWPDPGVPGAIRPRLAQQAVVHHNRYQAVRMDRYLPAYEQVFHAFRVSQNMKEKSWQEGVKFSVADMGYMDGREDLRASLEARGFGFK